MDYQKWDNRYVACFDVLGFKEAVKNNVDEAYGVLVDLQVSLEEALNAPSKCDPVFFKNKPGGVCFSDTVILFTRSAELEDLGSILISSGDFFAKALYRCIPLRGAISYGKFGVDFEKEIYCGVPLITAFDLAENAQWSGIVIDEGVADRYRENHINDTGRQFIVKRDLMFKDKEAQKKISCWVLDWPWIHTNNWKVRNPISAELYSKSFKRMFGGSYNDWSEYVQRKYDNTVLFVNASLRRNTK